MKNTISSIAEQIRSRENSNKPLPFWTWNDRLEKSKLKRQIDLMSESHLDGFFMHARGGLKTEYLSEEWLDDIKYCAEYAREKGMTAWIYDENGWPSGFAGGKLLSDPENRDCYITEKSGEFDPQASVSYLITEDSLIRTQNGAEKGEYLNIYINISPTTADILNPEVVDKFIALTHEKYKEYTGSAFSDIIGGFFTDEPQYFRWHTAYTRILPGYFREKYNEDIFDKLGLLFAEKDGYRLFRYRYWKAMQSLMLNNFVIKIYDWCCENGVAFTGHFVEENSLAWQMHCCAGIMPFYAYMSIPGIDWLGRRSSCELAPRQVASVAAQYGKERVITESFACCGWEVTPRDYRRLTDFQYVGGVNLMCEHVIPYSEHGQRKRDYPAHFLPANPWIENDFAGFNLLYTRLGNLIADSEEIVNVAVLHPIRSVYFDFKREADRPATEQNTQLLKDLRLLSGSGVSYHLLDETLLSMDGFVKNAKIGCKRCAYDFLVLPHIICMDESTERLLREYVENGGRVLLIGDKPQYREGVSFDYSYLSSNCTLDELIAAQPYRVAHSDTALYNTCRILNGKMLIFAVNSSDKTAFTQTYDFGGKYKSFIRLDLSTLEAETLPLTVTLEPGESALLFPDSAECADIEQPVELEYSLDASPVSFNCNQLRIDHVRFSENGIDYTKTYPCEGLFEKLIKERYKGKIYIKYEFDVRVLPERLTLYAEECRNSTQWINGHSFDFTGSYDKEEHVLTADIAKYVKTGHNEFTIRYDWYQSENVYYALFGENVTESLKNCLAYDTDLEAVYLSGDFGVYSDTGYADSDDPNYVYGKDFYIGAKPECVTEPTTDGFPFFTGTLETRNTVTLNDTAVRLRIPGLWQTAEVRVNGKYAGRLVYSSTIDISEYTVKGENIIEVDFLIGLRNLLGAHHYGGFNENGNISPFSYELTGTWNDGESKLYAERYNLLRLNCRKQMMK